MSVTLAKFMAGSEANLLKKKETTLLIHSQLLHMSTCIYLNQKQVTNLCPPQADLDLSQYGLLRTSLYNL